MQEALAVNANYFALFSEKDGRLLPQVECVLILSEPEYSMDAAGDLIRHRSTSQCRFSASPGMLRKMAESFNLMANEADALARSCNSPESANPSS